MSRGTRRQIAAAALALGLFLSNPSFAQTSDRFDLLCTGTKWDLVSGERTDATILVRVDLATHRFCFDDCDQYGHVYPISNPDSKTIRYDYDTDKAGPDHPAGMYRGGDPEYFSPQRERILIRLDDLTLLHDVAFDSGEPASQYFHIKWQATCTRAPLA